jgi:hypothetical protein
MKEETIAQIESPSVPHDQLEGEGILLNSLYNDHREKKPGFFIKLSSLLNEDVHHPKKYISDGIESIFITTFGFEV